MNPTLITFSLYIFAMIAIGFLAWRSTKNLSDYVLGGRRLGSFVTALSAGASDMSGWLLMGLPGAIYMGGISEGWIALGLTLGAWLNWSFVAAPLRVYTEKTQNALTLPDYFTHRFEDKSQSLKLISALIILFFFTIYCASGMVAGARLFEDLFHIPYFQALILGALATICYVLVGGFLAVSWTDTIQASLMLFALILVPTVVVVQAGGVGASLALIEGRSGDDLNFFRNQSGLGILSLLSWGLGYFGQPHILTRFMAADSHKSMVRARTIAMTWMVLCLLGAIGIGFFGIGYFESHPEEAGLVTQNREMVFVSLASLLFSPWLTGILLSGILAAIMSTLSCQLLLSSSTLTGDFYKALLRPKASEKELLFVSRLSVFLVSLVALLIAQNPQSQILGLVSYAWAGFGASFGPVVLLSLYWKGMTRNGALAALILGSATVILWQEFQWLELYEMIPGFLMGTLGGVVFSLFGPRPSLSMEGDFDTILKFR